MKEKTAAIIILAYTVLLALGVTFGAILGGNFSLMSLPVYLVMFVGPAIGIFRRINWCRVFLGCCFAFVLSIFLILPIRAEEFHFKPTYLLFLLGSGFPVYMLFFWKPLKEYTKVVETAPEPEKKKESEKEVKKPSTMDMIEQLKAEREGIPPKS
ncbi:MAG: hypothetical protein ACSHYA_16900 [Opitutaceae bacterium]